MNQDVTISLKDYDEFQELKKHEKEVKITEIDKITMSKGQETTGITVGWKSDGKCWLFLAGKLRNAGFRMKELMDEKKKLKKMSIFQFMKWRKQ